MVILSQKKEMFEDQVMYIAKSDVYNFSINHNINLEVWESDFVYLLEFDREVLRYYEKPFRLFNEKEECIPSFLVKYHSVNKKDELIYIEKNLNKTILLNEFCLENDIDLKIVLEDNFKKGYKLMNIKFLSNYINVDIINYSRYIDFFLESFETSNSISINEVMERFAKEEQKKAEVLYVILHLISIGFFLINLDEKLTQETLLSFNGF
ncbi:hypothetical protein [Empedobacter brevis]|uniref:hypothetical protein n=1 Tax=Empedobacter brevis TaxID=247 RepID=UPI00289A20A8|nr:hypothetical protein [Empedobacter brevis]